MYAHEAIRLRLLANSEVTAITDRIYMGFLSQSVEYPAASYRFFDAETMKVLEPFMTVHPFNQLFRFYSVSNLASGGADQAFALDLAILRSLDGFSGTITDATVSPVETVDIKGIFHQRTVNDYDDKSQTYTFITDYLVFT